MGSGDSDSVIRAVSVDEEDECVLPCTFSPGAYVEVVGHVVFGDGYEGSWHGAKVVRCHRPASDRGEWTYDIELVERAAQARQRRQVAAHIPADALRPQCPVQPFPDFCRLEPGVVVEQMLPEAPSVWWLGVVVQLEGCPIKSALVGYPVTPREAPGFAHTASLLRPAFHWDYETSCWCSIWQSQMTPEPEVQKCFNSHFKRYMGLPKCARVGNAVPRVQAVGTDYISTDTTPMDAVPSPRVEPPLMEGQQGAPQPPEHTTLPPLASMPPQTSASLPPSSAPETHSGAAEALPNPALKEWHSVLLGRQDTAGALPAARAVPYTCSAAAPINMLRSHSSSISGTHQPSGLRREVCALEATRSDAKYACVGEKAPAEAPLPPAPGPNGGHWMSDMGAHLNTMALHKPGTARPSSVACDRQPSRSHSGGALGVCNHARAEFKKQVSRAQLMRSGSNAAGVPGSVQLAAALAAAPDCSSPHAMESAATAAMHLVDCRDSGGSGSAVCGSSDVSGACMAERYAAGRASRWGMKGAAAVVPHDAAEQAGRSAGALGDGLAGKRQLSSLAGRMPDTGPPGTVKAAALMQRRPTACQQPQGGGAEVEQAKLSPADSLRMLTDVSEQEEAAVGLLCLRHHPDCWGGIEPGFWQCKHR